MAQVGRPAPARIIIELAGNSSCVTTTALSFVLTQKKQKVKQEHITPMFLQTP